jgi:hypothetical protein
MKREKQARAQTAPAFSNLKRSGGILIALAALFMAVAFAASRLSPPSALRPLEVNPLITEAAEATAFGPTTPSLVSGTAWIFRGRSARCALDPVAPNDVAMHAVTDARPFAGFEWIVSGRMKLARWAFAV